MGCVMYSGVGFVGYVKKKADMEFATYEFYLFK